MKKILKILLIVFLSILVALGLFIAGFNLFKYAIYSDYYKVKTDLVNNVGLGDNYVPQGVTKITYDGEDVYFTSGYMSNGAPSRIYAITNSNYGYVNVKTDSSTYADGHFGGISANDKYLFVASDRKVYIIEIKDVIDTVFQETSDKEPKKHDVDIVSAFDVEVEASYIFIDNQNKYLYVGEFYGHSYKTDESHHKEVTNGEIYHSYVSCYSMVNITSESTNVPLYSFVVRDLVQGIAISDDKIVLSTSYGLASSYFYVYDIPTEYDDKSEKLYYLDDRYINSESTIKAPAMAEGIDYDGEKFITLFESACNKYYFGKFFFMDKIVGLDL